MYPKTQNKRWDILFGIIIAFSASVLTILFQHYFFNLPKDTDNRLKNLEMKVSEISGKLDVLENIPRQELSTQAHNNDINTPRRRIHVQSAFLSLNNEHRNISPATCTAKVPCTEAFFVRGVKLNVTLNMPGFAAAYLQDNKGDFYNQEGSLFVENLRSGKTGLWPGLPEIGMAHQEFALYIVACDNEIPTFADDEPIRKLPATPNCSIWGPVHLSFRRRNQ